MRTEIIDLFKFDELSNGAKDKARGWYREGAFDYDWWDAVYEDAAQIADILGIDLRTKMVKLMGGGARQEPSIYFSGFSSQGDGACFEGSYAYAKGAAKKIRDYAPKDSELHSIADTLQQLQRVSFYKLEARVKHNGRYNHALCTDIDVFDGSGDYAKEEIAEDVRDALRDFMYWIYRALERNYEWLISDEQVDESIRCNEYEFKEDGSLA